MENIMTRIVDHWMYRSQAMAFDTWSDHAKKQARAENIVRRVLDHWGHRSLAMGFDTWADHAKGRSAWLV